MVIVVECTFYLWFGMILVKCQTAEGFHKVVDKLDKNFKFLDLTFLNSLKPNCVLCTVFFIYSTILG